jgi:hypothetical protein
MKALLIKIIILPLVSLLGSAGYHFYTPEQITPAQPVQDKTEVIAGNFNPVGGGTYRLQNSIGSSNSTINLSSFAEPISGIPYTMTYLNTSKGYATLDPQLPTKSEFISFTGITQNTNGTAQLTGVTRGISRVIGTNGCVASTTLASSHSGQSSLILSNSPCFYNEFAVKSNNETITGQWTFSTFPITPTTPISSPTTTGMVQIATQLQAASSTQYGSSGSYVVLSAQNSTSTYNSATAGLRAVITQNNGKIDNNFINGGVNPAGSIINYIGSTTVPTGYLRADGSAVSRTTYSDLFTAIGTYFGVGDGSTTFNLPVNTSNNFSQVTQPPVFNGSSQFLSVADTNVLDISGDITVEAWIQPTSTPASGGEYGIVSKYLTAGNQKSYKLTYLNTGGLLTLRFRISTNGSSDSDLSIAFASTSAATDNSKWYHVAVSYVASTGIATFYINGILMGTSSGGPSSIFNSTAPFQIGATENNNSSVFVGRIEGVKLFASALTQTEVVKNMSYFNSGTPTGSWSLNNSLLDTSGNNLTLTNNASTQFVSALSPNLSSIPVIKY